jgi:hypothetical protein
MVSHVILCYLMQNIVDFGTTLQKINVAKSVFVAPCVSKFFGSVQEMLYY